MTLELALTADLRELRARLSPAQGDAVATLLTTMTTANALALVRAIRDLTGNRS